jgi:magnesium transporter
MLQIVEFDFEKKVERPIGLESVPDAMAAGKFVWLDIDLQALETPAREIISKLCPDPELVEASLRYDIEMSYDLRDDALHLAITDCRLREQGGLEYFPVDVLIVKSALITVRRGKVKFMEEVRKRSHQDFIRFAKSPSFLLYEICDCLIESYKVATKVFEDEVEKVQALLMGKVDDSIFQYIYKVRMHLLHFRKLLLPLHSVLEELSTRRTEFVSESTQPFLANMMGGLDRLLHNITVDRETLSESLTFYVSVVGHVTNKVMKNLTVVSMMFLPLTFLCGVYGMNFRVLPEVDWQYGYVFFWGLAATIATSLVVFLKRRGLM